MGYTSTKKRSFRPEIGGYSGTEDTKICQYQKGKPSKRTDGYREQESELVPGIPDEGKLDRGVAGTESKRVSWYPESPMKGSLSESKRVSRCLESPTESLI